MRPVVVALGIFLLLASIPLAQVPELISYQGRLLDSLGQPVADGTYSMDFRFYDSCSGGNLLLSDLHNSVQTMNGIYSVLLGGGSTTPGLNRRF